MAILKVARMGNPVLREKAKEVASSEIKSKVFQDFIDSMIETMYEYGGVGLAAPQVHVSKRVAVIEFDEDHPRYKTKATQGLQVFINPKIKILTEETDSNWEGCLSVPGMRALVDRPNQIKIEFLDRDGKKQDFTAEGFLAVVIQHEFDHLDGMLYIDRARPGTLMFEEEFVKYHQKEDTDELD